MTIVALGDAVAAAAAAAAASCRRAIPLAMPLRRIQPFRNTPASRRCPMPMSRPRRAGCALMAQPPRHRSMRTRTPTWARPPGPLPVFRLNRSRPKLDGDLASAPIVRAGSVTGRSLTVVIAIMCFLACLTAGSVYMMYQAANAWLANMSNEITIQVEPVDNADTNQTISEIVSFLRLRPGISTVNPLDESEFSQAPRALARQSRHAEGPACAAPDCNRNRLPRTA